MHLHHHVRGHAALLGTAEVDMHVRLSAGRQRPLPCTQPQLPRQGVRSRHRPRGRELAGVAQRQRAPDGAAHQLARKGEHLCRCLCRYPWCVNISARLGTGCHLSRPDANGISKPASAPAYLFAPAELGVLDWLHSTCAPSVLSTFGWGGCSALGTAAPALVPSCPSLPLFSAPSAAPGRGSPLPPPLVVRSDAVLAGAAGACRCAPPAASAAATALALSAPGWGLPLPLALAVRSAAVLAGAGAAWVGVLAALSVTNPVDAAAGIPAVPALNPLRADRGNRSSSGRRGGWSGGSRCGVLGGRLLCFGERLHTGCSEMLVRSGKSSLWAATCMNACTCSDSASSISLSQTALQTL